MSQEPSRFPVFINLSVPPYMALTHSRLLYYVTPFRWEVFFKTLIPIYLMTLFHIPKGHNLVNPRREN